MEVYGWGRFPKASAALLEPVDSESLIKILTAKKKIGSMIARGAGRSYGDSALSENLISSRFLDSFLSLDQESATIRCGAGVSLDSILKVCIPRGWFLPVLPGTKFVSVGGAIAADIHGKNHHQDGSFCDHVAEFTLVLASGEKVTCSPQQNTELFHATCGGMGLTGIILDATIKCERVSSVSVRQRSLVANTLSECMELLDTNADSKYSVAWLDCLASGDRLGRSIIYLAQHDGNSDTTKEPKYKTRRGPTVPFDTPTLLINKFTMGLFNSAYFNLKKKGPRQSTAHYDAYFFPLDHIGNWNRLYGAGGFLQYQFVLPSGAALEGISQVLSKVSGAGKGSFLSVLKKFGKANANLLSFPQPGYTLTLDFKREKSLFPLLDGLDEIVLAHGGRIYLAKDARMSESVFKAGYPAWEKFLEIKTRVDPTGVFSSLQSKRIGLT
jgi:FAD/FMN-containing dehydrogenase